MVRYLKGSISGTHVCVVTDSCLLVLKAHSAEVQSIHLHHNLCACDSENIMEEGAK